MTLKARLHLLFHRNERNLYMIKQFMHAHKDMLIVVCDPVTDRIFVSHKDRFVNGKIKSTTGKNTHIVKEVLSHSRFKHNIDDFIVSLAETLNLPFKNGNQFYQFLDGALFNIAKSLRKHDPRQRKIIKK